MTLDADKDYSSTGIQFNLANKYGVYSSNKPDEDKNKQSVSIIPSDVSKTAIMSKSSTQPVTGYYIDATKELSSLGLRNVNVVEPKYDGDIQYTLLNNLKESKLLSVGTNKVKNSFDEDTNKLTSVITVDSSNFETIKVTPYNGVETEGKWMLTQLYVKGDISTFVDESVDKSAVFVDPDNSANLAGDLTYKSGTDTYQKLAVWINLSSDAIKAVTSKTTTETTTAFEVKFGSTSPVEEHNSFFIKFIDTNKKKELTAETVENVTVPGKPSTYVNADEEQKETFAEQCMGWGDNTKSQMTEDDMHTIAENMTKIENARITKEVHDDIIFMTIEADFKSMNTDAGKPHSNGRMYTLPLSFDISMLDNTNGGEVYSWGIGMSAEPKWEKDSNANTLEHKTTWSTPFRFKENGETWKKIQNGGYTKEFILTTQDMSSKQSCEDCTSLTAAVDCLKKQNPDAKYVCYVVTFKQI